MSPQADDQQLGEGFAFFRWHCLRWPLVSGTLCRRRQSECWMCWPEVQWR